MTKLTAIGVLLVALAAFAFSTSTRSADAAGPPAFVSVSASATCGGAITASALVRDAQSLPFVGASVTFTSSTGGVGSGVTGANGVATATLTMPVAYTNAVSVTASVAGGPSGSAVVGVNCAPGVCSFGYNCSLPGYPYVGSPYCANTALYIGYANNCSVIAPVSPYVYNGCYAYNCLAPGYYNTQPYNLSPCYGVCYGGAPAKINIAANPGALTCGGASSISANITDALGVPVPNGTAVSYSSSIGTIGGSAVTGGGNAVSTLNTAAGTSGVALITVKAGNASATTTIQVNCAVPAQQNVVVYNPGPAQTAPQVVVRQPQGPGPRPQVIVQAPAGIPPFAPPRTGSAGLLDQIIPNDDAANAALIDAFEHQTDVTTDAAVVDNTDTLNVDTDVDASMSSDINAQPLDFDASLIDGNQLADQDANASLVLESALQSEHAAGDFGLS